MTGWPAFAFIVAMFSAFIAWGCWCQHRINQREAEAKRAAMEADVRAAQVYRDAYNAALDGERAHLAAWEQEMQR